MAGQLKSGRYTGVRRRLVYVVVILAAGAAMLWIACGGFTGSDVVVTSEVNMAKPEDTGGGVDDEGTNANASLGGIVAAAAPAAPVVVTPAKAAPAKPPSVPEAEIDHPPREEIVEVAYDAAKDGENRLPQQKVIKVGQTQVAGSGSLDFSSERVKPGWMWLPVGLHEVSSGDPWVTMCLMDYGHYQRNPSATPMFTHMSSFSKCGNKRPAGVKEGEVALGSVELIRMSSLMRSIEESGRPPVPPKGFVYHETRCGSTLVANMLAALPPSRVFSESKPPTQTIRECYAEGCGEEMMLSLFRNVVALMGRRRENEKHEHLYFKFQNSKFIPEISAAFPEVPWVFVFRDPVEVMVSNLKSFVGAPCVRIPRQEKLRKKVGGGNLIKKALAPGNRLAEVHQSIPERLRERNQLMAGGKGPRRLRRGTRRRLRGQRGDENGPSPRSVGVVEHGFQEDDGELVFASISWNGFSGSGMDDGSIWGSGSIGRRGDSYIYDSYNSSGVFSGDMEGEFDEAPGALARGDTGRVLQEKKVARQMKLTVDMTKECADWLMSLCVAAVEGGKNFPGKALFVDYTNLPDAVPEYVYPEHFGMAAELDKTVPDWKERMLKAAGSYSKGGGKAGRSFAGDAEVKHKQASPLIVEAAESEGGLYDIYNSLDAKQTWHRPYSNSGSGGEANENHSDI